MLYRLINRKCLSSAVVVLFIKLLLVYLLEYLHVELISLETTSSTAHYAM